MFFKTAPVALAAAVFMTLSAPAAHAEGLSFNVGAVSLYKFKGIDLDSRAPKGFRPALQGGVDYEFGNGVYVGNWNSTGKFGNANLEVDLYAGYKGEITKDLSFDVGFASYLYPNSGGGWNGNELYGSLSYGIFTAKLARGVSGSIKKATRLALSVEQGLTDSLTASAGVGFRNNSGPSDFNLGLSYDLGNDLSATAVLSGAQRSKAGVAGKTRLVLGVSKSF